jgi:hypothetical protein
MSRLRVLAYAMTAVALAVGLTACGGGSSSKTGSTTSTTATKKKKKKNKPAKPTFIVEKVAVSGSNGKPAPATTAKPGDNVVFLTQVPAAKSNAPVTVSLSFPAGPSTNLTVKAGIKGHSAQATLSGAGGKALTLLRLHYHCSLPPAPGFCPPHNVKTSSRGAKFQVNVKHGVSVAIEATVGPVSLPPSKVKTPGQNVAPAYRITELLRAIPPGSKSKNPPAPAASATVHPKDTVQMLTRVAGRVKGAKQPVTISFGQGPASSLTVSASVPGGATSTATIKSANGSKITLVLPFYTCYLPPNPTFCPVTHTSTASHRYSVTIPAAPGASVPVVLGTVGAG